MRAGEVAKSIEDSAMSRRMTSLLSIALAVASLGSLGSAQTADRLQVVYSHHHLSVSSVEAHRRFWVDGLGGTAVTVGRTAGVRFPGVLVLLEPRQNTGGTKGTTVNHVGFQVRDLRRAIDRLETAGFSMVTGEEVVVPAGDLKDDIAYIASQDIFIAMTMGPDETKVELVENKTSSEPVSLHHVHLFTQSMDAMRDWYVKVLDATPGTRGPFKTAELPSVILNVANSPQPVVGTRGRVLDHIGFEVKDLEAVRGRLEAAGITFEGPSSQRPELGVLSAFFTDPWGTSVELTEGLDEALRDR